MALNWPQTWIMPMSALGQKQTCASQKAMSALPRKATEIADIEGSDRGQSTSALPRSFKRGLLRYGEGTIHINAEVTVLSIFVPPSGVY